MDGVKGLVPSMTVAGDNICDIFLDIQGKEGLKFQILYGNSNILKCCLLQTLVGTLTLDDLEVRLSNLGAVYYGML